MQTAARGREELATTPARSAMSRPHLTVNKQSSRFDRFLMTLYNINTVVENMTY